MISFTEDQKIIVTGASSGIGEGVALLLNELGATCIGIGRNQERLEGMKSKCEFPDNMFIENKDLTENIDELPSYIKDLKEKYGKFYGLACSAGIAETIPLQSLEYQREKKIFDINYFVPLFMAKGFADRRNNIGKGASIVFISSIAAIKADKGQIIYAASKAALATSGKSMARELSNQGTRVNSVSPSDIKTTMTEKFIFDEARIQSYPLGLGEVSDVANMVVYLLSDKAKWITGQNYIIDCGYL